ncbi:hypothetical protein [Akkermansia muciniphila]|uniref:hypothetical protein n=1 Tax=Akkermansia muciniphila TaxID=239935 RepID=UPI001BFEFAF8|nr:hypothetical protein [Akkermansia muciniphila]MBT8779206.1 hypothetical protein [Akkermansia muciniphila]
MMKRKVVPGKGEEEIILFLWQEGFEKHGWREVFMNGGTGAFLPSWILLNNLEINTQGPLK